MAKQRLNDTSALTSRTMDANECHTVTTRKLDNGGYLINRTSYNHGTGKSTSNEEYSESPPLMPERGISPGNPSPDQGNALRECMNYMKDGE